MYNGSCFFWFSVLLFLKSTLSRYTGSVVHTKDVPEVACRVHSKFSLVGEDANQSGQLPLASPPTVKGD